MEQRAFEIARTMAEEHAAIVLSFPVIELRAQLETFISNFPELFSLTELKGTYVLLEQTALGLAVKTSLLSIKNKGDADGERENHPIA